MAAVLGGWPRTLRTIGHVLDKTDAMTSSHHRARIDGLWEQWKADRDQYSIFWDFIEKERNSLLKVYSFGARLAKDDKGYYVEFEDGQDAFQLFRQAVYWWRHQLMLLEDALHQSR
jgi:hypothetical protein